MRENPVVSTSTQIGIMWDEGDENGGAPVLSYQLWTDQGMGIWTVLEEELQSQSYTHTGLIEGTTYVYKVKARTVFDLSDYSNTVSILAADIPYQVSAPTTSISGDNVKIDWVAPFNNGDPISSYTISIRHKDDIT